MDVGIEAAGHPDLTAGVDGPECTARGPTPGTADRSDAASGNADIGRLGGAGQQRGAAGDDQIEHVKTLPSRCGTSRRDCFGAPLLAMTAIKVSLRAHGSALRAARGQAPRSNLGGCRLLTNVGFSPLAGAVVFVVFALPAAGPQFRMQFRTG